MPLIWHAHPEVQPKSPESLRHPTGISIIRPVSVTFDRKRRRRLLMSVRDALEESALIGNSSEVSSKGIKHP
ncbi:MAG: hypothetical protein CBC48_00920 [bacterium TMED88]|nr:hypothetical protein [Deltaproteobacteria bacterium]OUV37212.1 MAG: hypothetical protein CBC48_00920 [bacterium TMED88]